MRKLFSYTFLILLSFHSSAQRDVFITQLNDSYSLLIDKTYKPIYSAIDNKISIKPRIYVSSSFGSDSQFNSYLLGLDFSSRINKKISIESIFDNLQDNYNPLVIRYIDSLNVYPRFNRERSRLQIKITYLLSKFFTINIGNGRNFIGDGYRSLLLSSNHSPYPYFKIVTNFGRVRYYNLFTTFLDMQDLNQNRKKHSSIHFLDFNITDNISLGVFEAVVWRSSDDSYNRGYDIEYLNPIIFYRPVEFSKHSPDNVLMGLNFNIKMNKSSFYSQVLLDDLNISRQKDLDEGYSGGFFQNKFGFQLGLKTDIRGCMLLMEYNQVQPYTYAHKDPMQTYTHLNQALAHPLGANFRELVVLSEYALNNWRFGIKYIKSEIGLDSVNTHYGQNIFLSDFEAELDGQEYSYGNFNGQGVLTVINLLQFNISYSLSALDVFASLQYRKWNSELVQNNNLWYCVGIRSFPFSEFYDY